MFHFRFVGTPRPIGPSTRHRISFPSSYLTAIVVALGLTLLLPRTAFADYCGRDDCTTATIEVSAINVIHYDEEGEEETELLPVEPDVGESWEITAYWNTLGSAHPSCDCTQSATAQVQVDVSWSDSTGWSASCTGCNAISGPVFGVTVCGTYGCGNGPGVDNSWGYELVVSLKENNGQVNCSPPPNAPGFVSRVEYQTTSVDDGNLIDTLYCSEGTAVSPISQTFGTTDSGPFECTYSCAVASGPTVSIVYD